MKFILSGDTHGTFDLDKIITFFQKQNTTYTKEDYLRNRRNQSQAHFKKSSGYNAFYRRKP